MNDSLVAAVAARLDQLAPRGAKVLIAVSGGRDSLALLHLLASTRELHRRELVVGHVDHGIAAESGAVAGMVERYATELRVPFVARRLQLGSETSETTARRQRRIALREMAVESGSAAIALAHHSADQAETVLLRVLKGSGPAGLAGMAPRRGPWVRPLLDIDPVDLYRHLDTTDLSHWQDPANQDPRHLRSWLRTVALPLLEERLPEVHRSLLQVAKHAASDRAAWNQVLELLPALRLERTGDGISVAAAALRGYRSEVQHAVISALGRRLGVPVGFQGRERVVGIVATGRSGSRVPLGRVLEAEIAFDRLIIRRLGPDGFLEVRIPGTGSYLAGEFRLEVEAGPAADRLDRAGWQSWVGLGEYLARPWQPGDRIRPLGGQGSRSVADLFKEARIAAGERRGWPILVRADQPATIVWVPGICRSDATLPINHEEGLVVECHRI